MTSDTIMSTDDSQSYTEAAVDLSPQDSSFPISLLEDGVRRQLSMVEAAAEEVFHFFEQQSPLLAQARQALQKGSRYVVNLTEQELKALDAGIIKLTSENGQLFAQLRDSGGHYGRKLSVSQEFFRKGIDPLQMANALQMQALMEQLNTISEQLSEISCFVQEVLQGQQNDRIALYYSGLSLFSESRSITNPDMRRLIVAQALRSLSEARSQLTLVLLEDIRYLANKEYRSAKGKSTQLIDERMQRINQCFAFIHQSSLLRAGIYCNDGEVAAMAAVLDEHSRFIEETIKKNIHLLISYDKNDDGTDNGVWSTRASIKLDASDFSKRLNAPQKVIYLGVSQEVDT